jgi:tetratricopeptide (TPR) repeat protein
VRAVAARHDLLVGGQGDAWLSLDFPGDAARVAVDADPGGGGPYLAAAALVRRIVQSDPAAAQAFSPAHVLTVLAVAPDLAPKLSVSDAQAASLTVSREGDARSWTLRLAHGLTDIVLAHFARAAAGLGVVAFVNADAADPLDQEFIAVLLRRADPRRVRVRVLAGADRFEDSLASALRAFARPIRTVSVKSSPPLSPPKPADDPALLSATAKHCMEMVYYAAALDYARRGRRALDPEDRGKVYAELTRHVIFASLLLARFDDVEQICRDFQPGRDDPALLAHGAYAMAILNARLYDPSRHDYDAARAWVEQSLAFTESLPPSEVRAVNLAFLQNTLALVQMRKGRLPAALRLLNGGLRFMAREAPGRFRTASAILLHNRARLRVMMKQPDAAIIDLTTLLRQEPSDSDAYVDRGLLHQRAGRYAAALADYDAAIAWSPPFETPHFNRAQVLSALGRPDNALRDYDRVLELNPDHAEARINRACLRYDQGDQDGARADVEVVLERAPDNARALCLRGLIQMAGGEVAEAHGSFTAAIAANPLLADAWANRAAAGFRQGDADAALSDLSDALRLREDPIVLCNRARIFESTNRWSEAQADYARALEIAPDLEGATARQRTCRRHLE